MDIFAERIKPLVEQSGMNEADLERAIGIPRGKIYDWKTSRVKSYQKYLPQIAAYFGVSVDYLTGASDDKQPAAQGDGLTEAEKRIIEAVRKHQKSEEFARNLLSILEQEVDTTGEGHENGQ